MLNGTIVFSFYNTILDNKWWTVALWLVFNHLGYGLIKPKYIPSACQYRILHHSIIFGLECCWLPSLLHERSYNNTLQQGRCDSCLRMLQVASQAPLFLWVLHSSSRISRGRHLYISWASLGEAPYLLLDGPLEGASPSPGSPLGGHPTFSREPLWGCLSFPRRPIRVPYVSPKVVLTQPQGSSKTFS